MAPQFIRRAIREMAGYTPGEQPAAGERVVKLNTNENPFPPSERVMAAIAGISPEDLRRYPDPNADVFRDAAARLHGVSRQHIIAGNGSDDILAIAMGTFVSPGAVLAYPEPTYSLYPVLAAMGECKTAPVPWENGWELPVARLTATGACAIFLANPNAPSGTFVRPSKIAELARQFAGLLLVDEAYADFAPENCVALVNEFPNVVVTRTLSKAYSLAGLRLGYAIAQPHVITQMQKVKQSYNCDAISIVAAAAAVEDQAYARSTWEMIKAERTRVTAELINAGWTVLPSEANFVFATVPGGLAKEAYLWLKGQGILVRYFDLPGQRDKLRITIGQSHENNALLAGIKMLTAAGKGGLKPMARKAEISRKTKETAVKVSLDLDGSGKTAAATGVGFLDHMLDLLGRHSLIDLDIHAKGDLQVDSHHTVEDVGIVLGQALDKALGVKRGIHRFGWAIVPMDETLAQVAIDLSGRPAFVYKVKYTRGMIGTFPTELIEEFFKALSTTAKFNLHISVPYGTNNHHIAEAIFKATAKALRQAVSPDPRNPDVPSTKGSLAG